MRALAELAAGYVRALGVVLKSLWQSLSGRGSLLLSLFLVFLLALLYLLGTEQGRVSLTRAAIYGAGQLMPELVVQAEGIRSEHLGAWYFSQLKIDYGATTLAQGRDLAVDVDLGALLRNRVDIESVSAAELVVNVDVLNEMLEAQAQATADVADESTEPLSIPETRLGSLRVDRLQVIDKRVPDLPVVSVASSIRYRWRAEAAQLLLEIQELDGAALHLRLEGNEVESSRFVLELSAREKASGFLGRYLQLPEGQALDARGKVSLQQPEENQLLIDIETFSLPLVQHQFSLSGRATATLSPWEIRSDGIRLDVDGSQHRVSGSVSAEQVDAEIDFNQLPVAISQPWQDFLVGGWLSADLSVRGPLSLPSVSGIVDLNSSYRERPLRLQGRVETSDSVIQLESASLEYVDTRLDAEGSVDIGGEAIDLRGEIQRVSVDDIRSLLKALPGTESVEIPEELQGGVDQLTVEAKGPWKNPALNATLKASPSYRQLDASLSAAVKGDLQELTIADFQLLSDRLNINGGGTVAIAKESLDLQLDVEARDFRPARDLGVSAAAGAVLDLRAAVGVTGPWANPQMNAQIQSDGNFRDYRFTLRGGAAGNLDKLVLDQLRLELSAGSGADQFTPEHLRGPQSLIPSKDAEDGKPRPLQNHSRAAEMAEDARRLGRRGVAWLEVDGVIEPKAGRAHGKVAGRNIPLSLAEVAGVELPATLEGQISIDGEFSGPFARPEAQANLLALGNFRGEPWQLRGDVGYGGGRVDLAGVELVWAERNQLSAHGSLNPKELDLEIRGRALLADLDIGLPADIADRGEITLTATAAGSPERPRLAGELRITSEAPGLARQRVEIKPLSLVLNWQTVQRDLQISLAAHHGARQAIDASASLAVAPILEQLLRERAEGERAPPLPLELRSRGSADLSVVAEFVDPEIHAMRGQLNFAISADGTLTKPVLDGSIELQGGSYEHRPSNTRLRNIDFLARLSPAEWRIVRARADDGERGSLSLSGAVTFVSPAPPSLDFELRADKAHLLSTPAVRGAISGAVALTGTTEDALLAGRLTLRPLAVQIEQLFGSSVPEIEVVEVDVDGPQVERAPPLLQKMALNIEVILDKQSYVRGLGLDSQLRGKVDIGGTAARPDASGELRIVRGSFDLFGKKFELQEGEVRFENNKAAIYVKGLHEYSDGEITAEISGTTEDLDVTFSSSPAAAQDEIFAQLLFGKSLTDISPLQAVRLVSVVRSLQSGGSVFDPVAKTRELLGVDTLDIETEESDEGDKYALSLGKYITNRIYIELQRSTDPLNPWQAEMQIELRRNLSLEIKSAQQGESGAGSVELQWKKDY
ncbi:autotransporter secretion inner membrane protein TamB [Microbulbifer donghaiensis]|uniref:Autotransporter secretion inner membrane protein TamB n=1 Tax=Microbulbifer donghaiensis TaxID=494016 RepID=A0A1M5H5F1_9GAMM|nr:translocation/assembly module TamB domain-containing protein [Microbulbifer donghaiensis]SHG11229.1 autotransporter secretion inner membrane protein TamB [Microbulbifer donghaiensis]